MGTAGAEVDPRRIGRRVVSEFGMPSSGDGRLLVEMRLDTFRQPECDLDVVRVPRPDFEV